MIKFILKTEYYLHTSKEENCEWAEEIGLVPEYNKQTEEHEKFLNNFKWTANEITLKVGIQKDGSVQALSLNGIELKKPVRI